jgi:anti-sigma B factor antagonist
VRETERRGRDGEVTLLTFEGEFDALDLATIAARIDTLIATGHVRLVWNLRRVTFITSSAVGLLIRTRDRLCGKGGDLLLSAPSPFVRKALHTLGLDELLEVFASDEAAIARFHGDEPGDPPPSSRPVGTTTGKLVEVNAVVFSRRGARPETA